MKTIVFGDAHGCIDQILALMDKIGPADGDRIISIGDFVDRGPHSPACVEFARRHEAIRGNHEHLATEYRYGRHALWESQIETREQFLDEASYQAALDYFETLPFFVELEEAILVHAGLIHGIPLWEQDQQILLGYDEKRNFWEIDPEFGLPRWALRYPQNAKPVIFGHITVPGNIPQRENIFGIDTGCWRGGKLTAVTLPDFKIYQVPGWKK